MDGHSHRQVIQSSVVRLDQCVVLRRPRLLSKFMEWRESSWSVVRVHGVLSERSELCQSSRSVAIANGVWSELMRCSCNLHLLNNYQLMDTCQCKKANTL